MGRRSQGMQPWCVWYALTALSAGSALAPALISAFDLAVHTVNLGEHVFGSGLHLQVG
jgi:hypothetical protein